MTRADWRSGLFLASALLGEVLAWLRPVKPLSARDVFLASALLALWYRTR